MRIQPIEDPETNTYWRDFLALIRNHRGEDRCVLEKKYFHRDSHCIRVSPVDDVRDSQILLTLFIKTYVGTI